MKKSSKLKKAKAKKRSISNVQKINKSEKSKAAAQLVETGSKLDQIISCDEQQDHKMSEYSKDVDEEDEDNDLKELFSSSRKKIEEAKRRGEEWKEETGSHNITCSDQNDQKIQNMKKKKKNYGR
jgi:hypothetical protein